MAKWFFSKIKKSKKALKVILSLSTVAALVPAVAAPVAMVMRQEKAPTTLNKATVVSKVKTNALVSSGEPTLQNEIKDIPVQGKWYHLLGHLLVFIGELLKSLPSTAPEPTSEDINSGFNTLQNQPIPTQKVL